MAPSTLARHRVRRMAVPRPPARRGAVPQSVGADGRPTARGRTRPPLRADPGPPRRGRPAGRLVRAWQRLRHDDSGMSTVEYAIGCVAAAAFAAVLYGVLSGESVVTALTQLVQRALSTEF